MTLQERYVSVVAPLYNDAAHLEESLTGLVNVLAAHNVVVARKPAA